MERKLTLKNYLGYAFCDIAGMLSFSVMTAYISAFYTDILKISGLAVFIILIIARIWDAINDPIMGFLVQNKSSGKYGKYRPFLLIGGIPFALFSILMFLKIPGLTTLGYTIYAAVTYILCEMFYTMVLIPYGSLASVMTTKENERSILSMCRSVGGGIGSLPAAMIFPLIVMVDNMLDGQRLVIAMSILAVVMIGLYFLSFRWTGEYAVSQPVSEKISVKSTLKNTLKDKAFVIMSLVGCLLMAASMYINTVNVYLFKDYYEKSGLLIFITVAAYIPMVVMIPFINKLIKKFGKKSIAVTGLIVSTIASFLIFVCRFQNPWMYIGATFFLNLGVGFLTLEVWAMAADVIDHQEWVTGQRAEAANYASFTFMRKIGQAIAALAPLLVSLAGYDSENIGAQLPETLEGMYTVAALVPFIIFAATLVLMCLYPLNKARMEKMHLELEQRRQSQSAQQILKEEG